MDIKKIAEEVIAQVQKDPSMIEKFLTNAEGTVKSLVGDDMKLDADDIQKIVKEVEGKVGKSGVESILGEAAKLFGK